MMVHYKDRLFIQVHCSYRIYTYKRNSNNVFFNLRLNYGHSVWTKPTKHRVFFDLWCVQIMGAQRISFFPQVFFDKGREILCQDFYANMISQTKSFLLSANSPKASSDFKFYICGWHFPNLFQPQTFLVIKVYVYKLLAF